MDTQQLKMQSDITGNGEPLVLVPGGLTGWLSWQPHAEQLAGERRVVRTQLLSVGLGLEGAPLPAGYSILTEKEALRHTLDDLSVGVADFAAWSYGALTTLRFALDYPERVRSLVLIEPPAFWVLRSRGPLPEAVLEEQRVLETYGPDEVTEDELAHFTHFSGIVPAGINPRELPQWPVWVEHRQSLRSVGAVHQLEDDIERVRSFNQPVLLLKGEGSSPYYHEIIDILGEELPNAHVEMLPTGHAPHIVSMEAFMRLLRTFLKDVPR